MTRLIANNAAGVIRWNKPDAIESAYIEFATADDSVIATVVALDKDGNELTRFAHPTLSQPDLSAFTSAATCSDTPLTSDLVHPILFSIPPFLPIHGLLSSSLSSPWSFHNLIPFFLSSSLPPVS